MVAMQFRAALLILGIAAGRKRIARSFSPRILEWLWMLIGIRLLLPQSIGIPILSLRHPWNGFPVTFGSLSNSWMWIRWGGTGIALLILVADYTRFYCGMRQKEALSDDAVCRWVKAHSPRLHFRIYTAPSAASPMVYGLFSPKIVLPVQQYSTMQYEYILLHEWMHIRRLDLWKKAFMFAAAVLNWYNPACWLMLLLFNRDIELACDADVLRALSEEEHAGYAHVLLDCYCRMNPSAISGTGFLSGILQERIGAIMNQKKISLKAKCCTVFLLGGLFLAAFGKISIQAETPAKMPSLVGKSLPETEMLLQEEGYAWSIENAR